MSTPDQYKAITEFINRKKIGVGRKAIAEHVGMDPKECSRALRDLRDADIIMYDDADPWYGTKRGWRICGGRYKARLNAFLRRYVKEGYQRALEGAREGIFKEVMKPMGQEVVWAERVQRAKRRYVFLSGMDPLTWANLPTFDTPDEPAPTSRVELLMVMDDVD